MTPKTHILIRHAHVERRIHLDRRGANSLAVTLPDGCRDGFFWSFRLLHPQGLSRSAAGRECTQFRAFEGLKIHGKPAPGLVAVVFHTYFGFIVFVIQTEHRFWAPPEDALEALRRLHRFNLSWGMFAYGVLVIPFLSLGNYLSQKKSIRRQETAMID